MKLLTLSNEDSKQCKCLHSSNFSSPCEKESKDLLVGLTLIHYSGTSEADGLSYQYVSFRMYLGPCPCP